MGSKSVPVLDSRQLRHRRIAAGMSQNDLALASGCTGAYISLMERGRRQSPSAHQFQRLAGALGCEIADLMLPNGERP